MDSNLLKYWIIPFFLIATGYGQNSEIKTSSLTGNLYADSKILMEDYKDSSLVFTPVNPGDQKSPLLAGVMSAVLPGSGELYVGDYLKAAIFFAVEAAFIAIAVINDKEGNDLTAEFEAFADEHWSVVDYSNYLLNHKNELGIPEECNITISDNTDLPPWERILNWTQLNECEQGFSHHLPRYGEQQYYEQIGKYGQYSSGWDEFDPTIDGFRDVPQIMRDYSVMRGNANDAYNVASKAVIGIYVNHLLSAIDAVWSATSHNKDLAVKMRMQNIQFAGRVELVPTLNIRYQF